MPRITNTNYLERRQQLIRQYRQHRELFSYLSVQAQNDLHVYFQTTNFGSAAELIAERARLAAEDPSLPQRAGKAFVALGKEPAPDVRVTTPAGGRGVYARGVMRAEPDVQQLARALLKLADELAQQEQPDEDQAA